MARWWYDIDIPFNAYRSPYYRPMSNVTVVAGECLKGFGFRDIRATLLHDEVGSINEYLKGFKESSIRM